MIEPCQRVVVKRRRAKFGRCESEDPFKSSILYAQIMLRYKLVVTKVVNA